MIPERVLFVTVWTVIIAIVLATVALVVAALMWLAFVGVQAFDAWLSADPLRPVALGVGGLALVALAVVRLEVGE